MGLPFQQILFLLCGLGIAKGIPDQKTASAEILSGPVNPLQCKQEGELKPDAENIRAFYQCFHGTRFSRLCPNGLCFHPTKHTCDWPENVPGCCRPIFTGSRRINCETEGELIPDLENSRAFYQCLHGARFSRICPNGLCFNPSTQKCDWPENVSDCNKPICKGPSRNTNPSLFVNLICQKEGEFFADPHNCQAFYQCSHGMLYPKICPDNLYFNPKIQVCDWPKNVDCGQKTSTKVTTNKSFSSSMTTEPSVTLAHGCTCDNCNKSTSPVCLSPNDLFPNDANCLKFYECISGVAHIRNCPKGLHYSAADKKCDIPEKALCVEHLLVIRPLCPERNGLYPHEKDCRLFYHCSNNYAYLKKCPKDLYFNKQLKVCDRPEDAGCDAQDPGALPDEGPFTGEPGICKHPSGIYTDPDDCQKFYYCSNGTAYIKDCPSGLHFNSDLLACDWPEKAGCNGPVTDKSDCPITPAECENPTTCKLNPTKTTQTPTKTTEETKTTAIPFTTPITETTVTSITKTTSIERPTCKYEGQFLEHEYDCRYFYHCSHGIPYLKVCKEPLLFNIAINVCDWPRNVKCRNPSTSGTSSPSKPTKVPPFTTPIPFPGECEYEGQFLADPTSCRYFYHCSHGIAYRKICPANLHFNTKLNVCDWPENSGCSYGE